MSYKPMYICKGRYILPTNFSIHFCFFYVITFPILRTLYAFYGEQIRDIFYLICIVLVVLKLFYSHFVRVSWLIIFLGMLIASLLTLRATEFSNISVSLNIIIDFTCIISALALLRADRSEVEAKLETFVYFIFCLFIFATTWQAWMLLKDNISIILFRDLFSYTNVWTDFGPSGIWYGNHSISSSRVALLILVLCVFMKRLNYWVRFVTGLLSIIILLLLFNKAALLGVIMLCFLFIKPRIQIPIYLTVFLLFVVVSKISPEMTEFVTNRIREGGGDRGSIIRHFMENIDINLLVFPFVIVDPYLHYFGDAMLYPHNYVIEFLVNFGVLGLILLTLFLISLTLIDSKYPKYFIILGIQLLTAGNFEFNVYFFSALSVALVLSRYNKLLV